MERPDGSFEKPFNDTKDTLSQALYWNGLNLRVIQISLDFIDEGEKGFVLPREDVAGDRNFTQNRVEGPKGVDSYFGIHLVLAEIDLSNTRDPHGIAVDKKILCRSNPIFELKIGDDPMKRETLCLQIRKPPLKYWETLRMEKIFERILFLSIAPFANSSLSFR